MTAAAVRAGLEALARSALDIGPWPAGGVGRAALRRDAAKGGTLFFCGNGGSAADAQHLATEYVVRYAARAGRSPPSRSPPTPRCSPPPATTSASSRSSRARSRRCAGRATCSCCTPPAAQSPICWRPRARRASARCPRSPSWAEGAARWRRWWTRRRGAVRGDRPDPGAPPRPRASDRRAGRGAELGPRRMIALRGRTALVTGGEPRDRARGRRLLARAGADVAIGFRSRARRGGRRGRGDPGARAARDRGRRRSRRSRCRRCELVARRRRAFGRLDFFVANAGIWPAEDVPLGQLTDEPLARDHGRQPRLRLSPTRAALRPDGPAGGSSSSPARRASAARRATPTTPRPRAR